MRSLSQELQASLARNEELTESFTSEFKQLKGIDDWPLFQFSFSLLLLFVHLPFLAQNEKLHEKFERSSGEKAQMTDQQAVHK